MTTTKFLPHATLEDKQNLILHELTFQQLNVDSTILGRHSSIEVLFQCVVCKQPIKLSKKRVLDGKGLSHPGECRTLFRQAGGKKARENEDPIYKEIRKQKLREKIEKDNDKIVAKRQETLIKKYGTTKFSQIESIRTNISNGIKKVYLERGEEVIKERHATNLEKYGSTNFLTSDQGLQVVQEMSMKYFGTKYPFQNKQHRLHAIESSTKKMLDGTPCYRYLEAHPNQKYINRSIAYKILDSEGEVAFKVFCNKLPSRTRLEFEGEKLLNAKYFNHFPTKTIRFKPDLILENGNDKVFINLDGLYWHSELEKEIQYHTKIREEFEKNSLQILQFREDEIYDRPEIVKSITYASLNIFENKYDARKCTFAEVSREDAKFFLEENHLMGDYGSAKPYGLYFQDELVMLISIRKSSQVEDYIEIARLCSKKNSTIRGGFQKLLHNITKLYNPTGIISFCDLRYATGRSYIRNGFTLESISQGWQWTDFRNTFNRLRCKANMDDRRLTEKQQAEEFGWVKIFDAGQAKYVKKLK